MGSAAGSDQRTRRLTHAVADTYTEGLTTPDLVDATAQLNSLA
jgi:hypothetical protein